MGLADCCRGFLKIFAAGADTGMHTLDSGFRLHAVVAEFGLAAHCPLRFAKGSFVPLEAIDRVQLGVIAQRSEPCYPHINANDATVRNRLLNLGLRLYRNKPLTAGLAHGDVLHSAQHVPAMAITQPTEL